MDGTEEILGSIRGERGYTLSYHEIYARLEPQFIEAYLELYRACTLRPRQLTPRQRELVWICLLAAIREEVGSIHIERAHAVGVSNNDVAVAIRLAGIADAWSAIEFAYENWGRFLEGTSWDEYDAMVEVLTAPLEPEIVHLALATAHGAHRQRLPFVHHLSRLQAIGVDERSVGEALSYIMQPVGANTLLWVTDTWLDALRDGELEPSPTLGTAVFETRRR